MAYGLIGMGNQQRDTADKLFQANAQREVSRNNFNQQLDFAQKSAQQQAIGMGAGIGGSIAAANIGAAGGIAAAGGAAAFAPIAVGAIAAYALTELF